MNEPVAIGVDLGGTHIKFGVCDAAGELHYRRQIDTEPDRPADQIAEHIAAEVQACCEAARAANACPTVVGVVMPGLLSEDRTTIRFVANIPNLDGFALPSVLAERFDVPVVFDADCNGAAWAEYRFGAGRDCDRLVMMTVGTGIGVGVVTGGALVRTSNRTAGSLGHILVDPSGPRCACGARGCLERMAGLRGIEDEARRQVEAHPDSRLAAFVQEGRPIGGSELVEALTAGDDAAGAVVRRCGDWLGVGIASLSAMFLPRRVVLGGGLAALGAPLLEATRDSVSRFASPVFTKSLDVVLGELGNDAGMIGAAALALDQVR